MDSIRAVVWSLGSVVVVLSACAATGSAAEVVAVVSAKNLLPALTREQVADIFLGKTSRFPDGSPAIPIDQVEGSPAREDFYKQIAGKSPAQMKAHWSKIIFTGRGQPPREVSGSSEVHRKVLENPGTIGYIDAAVVDGAVKVLSH